MLTVNEHRNWLEKSNNPSDPECFEYKHTDMAL